MRKTNSIKTSVIKTILSVLILLTLLSLNWQNLPDKSSDTAFIPLEEVDPESGAITYLLGADERPADNIYGEQPYGDPSGRRIAIRYYGTDDKPGGISIIDLVDKSRHDILTGNPRFPAFHAWGDYLYYQEEIDTKLLLRRCHYLTLKVEDIAVLPPERGRYSYGTVSPDHRYYAVCVRPPDAEGAQVHMLDLKKGKWSLLLDKKGYHAVADIGSEIQVKKEFLYTSEVLLQESIKELYSHKLNMTANNGRMHIRILQLITNGLSLQQGGTGIHRYTALS